MEPQPTKTDIEAVFHRLRAIPTNKTCFDCNAKNPSWSSVTYGVFICLDCSAVHRSLGVHLTFVRSTQLDTNWTWIQLRQMQLGGNSNALQFFQQHNCNTTDAQKKYNSRAAQLYREKLQQAALQSLKNNTQLHIHPMADEKADNAEKEVDFFSEHENFTSPELPDLPEQHLSKSTIQNPEEGPKVDFSVGNSAEPRKSTITTRKPPAKKLGLGAKKGGLGATKVKTNFAELEKEAELAEQSRLRAQEESARAAELSVKEQEEREAAVRLAYKDLSKEVQKKEEQVRKQDPRKAEQVERLGMGINSRAGVSHSAISDMQVIEQENQQSMPSTLSSLGKLRISDIDNFFDEYAFYDKMVRNPSGSSGSFTSGKTDSILAEVSASNSSRDNWVIIDDPPEKPRSTYKSYDKPRVVDKSPSSGESAQQKFGNAKAISSDQYFNNQETDYETKANLNRFQGSSSISSAEFFGNGSSTPQSYNNLQQYDLDDVKESVRQGVTKVAGKIGSLANGFMSSLQERYGY